MFKARFVYLFALVLTFNSLAEQPAGFGADDLKTFKFYDPQALLEPPEKPFAETSDRLGGWLAKPVPVPPEGEEYYPMRVGPGPQDFMPVQGKTVGEYVISGDLILGLARDLRPVPADPEKFRLAIMGKMVGHGWKKDSGFLWPHGLIPVLFEPNLPDNIRNSMLKAMSEWNSQTNIKFIDVLGLTGDQVNRLIAIQKTEQIGKWVWVTSQMIEDESCKASVGKQKGFTHPLAGDEKYTLNGIISMSCENPEGAAIHELGHVIGLFHEHMRADRGKYVSVGDGYGKNYDIVRDGSVGTHGTMFDTKSVMIYWNVIDKGSGKEVGYNQTLSAGDIKTVNRMYPNPEKGEEILKKILPDVRSERVENSSLSAGLGYDGLNELSTQNQP